MIENEIASGIVNGFGFALYLFLLGFVPIHLLTYIRS